MRTALSAMVAARSLDSLSANITAECAAGAMQYSQPRACATYSGRQRTAAARSSGVHTARDMHCVYENLLLLARLCMPVTGCAFIR